MPNVFRSKFQAQVKGTKSPTNQFDMDRLYPDPFFGGNFGGLSQYYRCFMGIFYMAALNKIGP